MTIKEAVIQELKISVDDAAVDKALIDASLTGNNEYTSGSKGGVDLVVISILESLLASPDVSEGGYSIKYNYKAIESRLATMKAIYFPETVAQPTVKAVKVW